MTDGKTQRCGVSISSCSQRKETKTHPAAAFNDNSMCSTHSSIVTRCQ